MLIKELEVGAHSGRQPRLAPADDDGKDEQLALVDQPGLESLCPEVRASYRKVAAGRARDLPYRGGGEMALENGVGSRDRGEACGVHDFARRLPGLREIGHEVGLRGQSGFRLPDGHRLVQAPPVEKRADRPHEFGNEREYLIVDRQPVERSTVILDIPVE